MIDPSIYALHLPPGVTLPPSLVSKTRRKPSLPEVAPRVSPDLAQAAMAGSSMSLNPEHTAIANLLRVSASAPDEHSSEVVGAGANAPEFHAPKDKSLLPDPHLLAQAQAIREKRIAQEGAAGILRGIAYGPTNH